MNQASFNRACPRRECFSWPPNATPYSVSIRRKRPLCARRRLPLKDDFPESNKVATNPVRLVHRRREDNGRIRWLSADEEKKLRAVIEADSPNELPAFDLALHTGMRRSKQYFLTWDCVDLERRQVTIPRSKNGKVRYIPLHNTALDALRVLRARSTATGHVMVCAESGHGFLAGH